MATKNRKAAVCKKCGTQHPGFMSCEKASEKAAAMLEKVMENAPEDVGAEVTGVDVYSTPFVEGDLKEELLGKTVANEPLIIPTEVPKLYPDTFGKLVEDTIAEAPAPSEDELREIATRETIDNDPIENVVLADALVPETDDESRQAEADEIFMRVAAGGACDAREWDILKKYGMLGPDGLECPDKREHEEVEGCKYCPALANG